MVMNRLFGRIMSAVLSLMIAIAYLPAGEAWAVYGASSEENTEAAAETAASALFNDEFPENGVSDENGFTETEESDADTGTANKTENTDTEAERLSAAAAGNVTADKSVKNGTIELSVASEGYSGRALPDDGYDLASIRQIWTDGSGRKQERYIDYKEESSGYSFSAEAQEYDSEITACFYSLSKWDGAVDLTWYDPDAKEYEISTPAQLAGLAAITNGMVDQNVTEEWMIKDNDGRQLSGGKYSHRYISTEAALADLLTPNAGSGASQVRDTVWRLPEVEHRREAEDDLHNDFMYRTVKLSADLDMSGANWTPVGGKYAMDTDATTGADAKVIDTRFQGVFDGQGHTVTLDCDRRAKMGFAYAMEIALIGYLGGGVDYKNGYPKDTCMEYAKYWVPSVRNVVVRGDIKGRRMVGGVVGRTGETNYGVLVENCANYASVFATDMRGCAGIVGAAWGRTTIRNCYNSGTIRSNFWEHGGIVGSNGYEGSEGREPAGADIFNCYNAGKTGIAGSPSDDPVYDGQEIGTDGQAFAGYSITNSYYEAPTTAISGKTGYSAGDTSINRRARINKVESADLRSDQLLDALNANGNVYVKDTAEINNGYPLLWYQAGSPSETASVTLVQSSGGSLSSPAELRNLPYGTAVELKGTPDKGKRLSGYKVNDGTGEKTVVYGDFFIVTGKDVSIQAVFTDMAPSKLILVEEDDGAHYYVKAEQIYDADKGDMSGEPVELHTGSELEPGDVIRITPVDIDLRSTQPDIKYLEYTGGFSDPVFTEWSLEVKNKASRTYTVTGETDVIEISYKPGTRGKMWISAADDSWYEAGKNSFTLTSAKQLAGLAKLCNEGNDFKGVTIKLGNDIGLENTSKNSGDTYGYERSWIGIGTITHPFKGVFDGQGHIVRYIHRNFAQGYCEGSNGGLFGVAEGAVIRNVNVESGTYLSNDGAETECGFINGCNGGGIAGDAVDTIIENCVSRVKMEKAFSTGGIAGIAEGNTVIRNCKSECEISGSSEAIGGIAGKLEGDGVLIEDCANSGALSSTSWKVGGILGSGETYSGTLMRCVNTGALTTSMKVTSSNAHAVGGIIGFSNGNLSCSQSINRGSLTGNARTYAMGGIAGTLLKGTIRDCYNTGNIRSANTSDNAETAGIANVGDRSYHSATVIGCYNSGIITAGSVKHAGGTIGYGSASTNSLSRLYCTDASVAAIGRKAGISGTVVSAAALKANPGYMGDGFVRDSKNINNGFPVLMWQDPEAVAYVNIDGISKRSISILSVSWSAHGPAEGVEVYRSVNGGGFTRIYSGSAAGLDDKKLSPGSTYTYRARAYRTIDGELRYGDWSASASKQLLLDPMKIKSVKNSKKKTAEIRWKRVKDAAGYVLYRSTSPNSGFRKIGTVKVTKKNKNKKTLAYNNRKLKKKKTYYYRIRYYKKINGKSVYSEDSAVRKIKIRKG